jgi:hypothetical protein
MVADAWSALRHPRAVKAARDAHRKMHLGDRREVTRVENKEMARVNGAVVHEGERVAVVLGGGAAASVSPSPCALPAWERWHGSMSSHLVQSSVAYRSTTPIRAGTDGSQRDGEPVSPSDRMSNVRHAATNTHGCVVGLEVDRHRRH